MKPRYSVLLLVTAALLLSPIIYAVTVNRSSSVYSPYIATIAGVDYQTVSQVGPVEAPPPHDFIFWKDGSTYYMRNEATDAVSSDASFRVLFNAVKAGFAPGDVVYFTGNTEYITDQVLQVTTNNITFLGDLGSDGISTSTIRAYSSSVWTGSYLVDFRGDGTHLKKMRYSGLGSSDNLDWTISYVLVYFGTSDDLIIENCTIEHSQQYLLQMSECNNATVRYNTIRYGQNGIAFAGSPNADGVVEYNTIHDCSQAPIKLRGNNGTIVRYNNIHNEYTYWRSFDHLSYPGVDGRGILGHSGTAAQGIYFGVTDPEPCYDCDVYSNTIVDTGIHGTVQVQDVVDGTWRYSPTGSQGCRFPNDAGTPVSTGNLFHDNTVTGCYYSVWIESYTTRGQPPIPLTVSSNTFTNTISNYCNLS